MSAEVKPLPDRPLSSPRAMERIRLLWRENFVVILPHAQRRMLERKIDMLDIEHMIQNGSVVEHSKPGQYWRYVVKGRSVDGDQMQCVTEINGQLIVVTVIV